MSVTVLGPVACRSFELKKKCEENQGHRHNYDHVTFVQAGSLKVFWKTAPDDPENESRVFKVGEFFLVKKDVYHRIKAMKPGTRYVCVFTHRDFGGETVVQEYNGYLDAYDLAQEEARV